MHHFLLIRLIIAFIFIFNKTVLSKDIFIDWSTYTKEYQDLAKPSSPITYEIKTWNEYFAVGSPYKDIDTLINQRVIIYLNYPNHNIVEYPNEAAYNECKDGNILVDRHSGISSYNIDLLKEGIRYIGCSVNGHDCIYNQKFKIITWPNNKTTATIGIEWKINMDKKDYVVNIGDNVMFVYNENKYNVIEIKSQEDYEKCRIFIPKDKRKYWTTGEDMVEFEKSGVRFFSSFKNEKDCENGLKIRITTVKIPASTVPHPSLSSSSSPSISLSFEPSSEITKKSVTPSIQTVPEGISFRKCSVDTSIMCTQNYQPYQCGTTSCFYSNDCYAKAAGFNLLTDCKVFSTKGMITVDGVIFLKECKIVSLIVCPSEYKPLFCGDNCIYSNECLAEAAGHNVFDECNTIGRNDVTSIPLPTAISNYGPKGADSNDIECPAYAPLNNIVSCTTNIRSRCVYGEETCCPNGGEVITFHSLIAKCVGNVWQVLPTEACILPTYRCKPEIDNLPWSPTIISIEWKENMDKKNFMINVGDKLKFVFNEKKHIVFEFLSEESYEKCEFTSKVKMWTTGEDIVDFKNAGVRFFSISQYGSKKVCVDGLKIRVTTFDSLLPDLSNCEFVEKNPEYCGFPKTKLKCPNICNSDDKSEKIPFPITRDDYANDDGTVTIQGIVHHHHHPNDGTSDDEPSPAQVTTAVLVPTDDMISSAYVPSPNLPSSYSTSLEIENKTPLLVPNFDIGIDTTITFHDNPPPPSSSPSMLTTSSSHSSPSSLSLSRTTTSTVAFVYVLSHPLQSHGLLLDTQSMSLIVEDNVKLALMTMKKEEELLVALVKAVDVNVVTNAADAHGKFFHFFSYEFRFFSNRLLLPSSPSKRRVPVFYFRI